DRASGRLAPSLRRRAACAPLDPGPPLLPPTRDAREARARRVVHRGRVELGRPAGVLRAPASERRGRRGPARARPAAPRGAAAAEYGACVTGITISREQARLARDRTAGLPVEIREQDYREVEGRFSKVASIEMLEAIGERQFGAFFATIDRVLEPGGLACVQTILVPDRRWERYRKTPDWIERYVFPGCLIPSLGALTRSLGRLELRALEEIGEHYAATLRRWRSRFHAAGPHDERFARTWDFYLAFSEAAFRTGALRDAQLVLGR